MSDHCLYVTCHKTGKFYLGNGLTSSVSKGWYKGSGKALLDAFKKYPREEWITEIVRCGLTEAEAYELEALYVDEDLLNDSSNLNLVLGGKGGRRRKQSDEEKMKRSKALKAALSSPEKRMQMSAAAKVAATKPETIKRRSQSTKAMWAQKKEALIEDRRNNPSYGPAWRAKLSQATAQSFRKRFKVEVNSVVYQSQRQACKELGLTRQVLRKLETFKELG